MKGCSIWAESMKDSPVLAAHLATCPQCQEALRESTAMSAKIDEALYRSAAVEPPLYGPERVMARIQLQADTRAWWTRAVVGRAAVGSALLALLIATVMWVKPPAPQARVTALSAWRSPTEALLRPPVAAAWTTRPQLGEGFLKMKPSGEKRVP